jgi:hypothetical protein
VNSAHKTFKEYLPAPHREVSILRVEEDHIHPLVVAEVQDPEVAEAEVLEAEVAATDRTLIII